MPFLEHPGVASLGKYSISSQVLCDLFQALENGESFLPFLAAWN